MNLTYTQFKAIALQQGIRAAMRHAVRGCHITIAQAQLWGMQFKKQYRINQYSSSTRAKNTLYL